MSLFFEDEIRKVMKKMDRAGIEELKSQDPRNKSGWPGHNPNRLIRQSFYQKNSRNYGNRPDRW